MILLTKVSDPTQREWYAVQAVQNGWPRDTLGAQIKGQLHQRQGRLSLTFLETYPTPTPRSAGGLRRNPNGSAWLLRGFTVVLVYTPRGLNYRIISMRKATPYEEAALYKYLGY